MEKKKSQSGFAMLFTVMIISIILALALGIADTTFKQSILSSLAANSQAAFYQADAGVECGMYYDMNKHQFVPGQVPTPALSCGNTVLTFNADQSSTDYFVYQKSNPDTAPCFSVTVDKTDTSKIVISSSGYSTCTVTAQQVERGLNVTY